MTLVGLPAADHLIIAITLTTLKISATVNGHSNYAGSSSPTTNINLQSPAPVFTLSPSSPSVPAEQTVTLNALVDGSSKTIRPGGTVSFFTTFGNQPVSGTVTYTPTADGNGNLALQASITITPSFDAGYYASYSGDPNYPAVQQSNYSNVSVTGNDFGIVSIGGPVMTIPSPGNIGDLGLAIAGQSGYNGRSCLARHPVLDCRRRALAVSARLRSPDLGIPW